MEITYLVGREQVSRDRARDAASPEARASHLGLARGYAALLIELGFAEPLRAPPLRLDEASENPDRGRAAA